MGQKIKFQTWVDQARVFAQCLPVVDAAHDFFHIERVAKTAVGLVDAETQARDSAQVEVLRAQVQIAAYLHDAHPLPKDSPDRARGAEWSALKAREVMGGIGIFSDWQKEISDAIRTHSFSAGLAPVNHLGRWLQDADRLEAIGAIGIARCFATAGKMGSNLFDPQDFFARHRLRDDRKFAVDHFFIKLFELEKTFCTEAGRQEAKARTAFMREFIERLAEEVGAGTLGNARG